MNLTHFSHRYAALLMPTLAVLAAFGLWLWVPREQALGWLAEGSVVEMLTQILYLALVPVLLRLQIVDRGRGFMWSALAVVIAGFGAREADLHTAWTSKSVLKVSFYLGDAPWAQKLLAGVLVAAIAMAAGYLVLLWGGRFWSSFKQRQPVAVTLLVFGLTLVVSKVFDRSVGILMEDFGVMLLESTRALATALEELLELSLPLLAGQAIGQHRCGSVEAA